MKTAAALMLAGFVTAGCSGTQPARILAGDPCNGCRKVISDLRTAAELVDRDGHAYKFHSPGCMAKYLKAKPSEQGDMFVADHATGRLVTISAVKFVPTTVGEGRDQVTDYLAYYSGSEAAAAAERAKSTPIDWQKVMADAKPD